MVPRPSSHGASRKEHRPPRQSTSAESVSSSSSLMQRRAGLLLRPVGQVLRSFLAGVRRRRRTLRGTGDSEVNVRHPRHLRHIDVERAFAAMSASCSGLPLPPPPLPKSPAVTPPPYGPTQP